MWSCVTCGFNPRPPLLAGDASRGKRSPHLGLCFNPRPPLLAGDARLHAGAGAGPGRRFNPRPPLLAGDAIGRDQARSYTRVSIRARHCWRAMRLADDGSEPGAMFQSAPAIAGGRCARCWRAVAGGWYCFNPRPPLLAGDAPRCQGIANSSLFPYRARTPAAPSKGQTKIACEKEKPFGNNTLRSARTCLMQRHHFRFAALTIAWHPCPTAPAAHQNPRP